MFENCGTVGDVKSLYKALCFQFHPDVSGFDSTRKMQDINAEYFLTLKGMDGQVRESDDGKERKYQYNQTYEEGLVDTMARLIRAQLPDHITVEIVVIYIWITGTRKADVASREKLKKCKCQWHSGREKWFWKPPEYKTYYNRKASYDDLKFMYGSREVEKEKNTALAPA